MASTTSVLSLVFLYGLIVLLKMRTLQYSEAQKFLQSFIISRDTARQPAGDEEALAIAGSASRQAF